MPRTSSLGKREERLLRGLPSQSICSYEAWKNGHPVDNCDPKTSQTTFLAPFASKTFWTSSIHCSGPQMKNSLSVPTFSNVSSTRLSAVGRPVCEVYLNRLGESSKPM